MTPDKSVFCRTCRRHLTVITVGNGIGYKHTYELQGRAKADHPMRPIPLVELENPYIECDFCSHEEATFVYVCADQVTTGSRRVLPPGGNDHQGSITKGRLHRPDRGRGRTVQSGLTSVWGERWAACPRCADLIEEENILGLISRVASAMPAKLTRGKKLLETRGSLFDNYTTFFKTRKPGRGKIAPGHPAGVWEKEERVQHD